MGYIINALRSRQPEVRGYAAKAEDVDRLAKILQVSWAEDVILAYREFPVGGMMLEFTSESRGSVRAPGPDFWGSDDYDPHRDHVLYWLQPGQVVWEIECAYVGRVLFTAGFVPIGSPGIGGDPYYLRPEGKGTTAIRLYRVWSDWVKPDDVAPIPPQAVRLVATSFVDVLRVARFSKGPTPV